MERADPGAVAAGGGDQVVDAADSIVFRLMFNSLRAAYEPALEALDAYLDGIMLMYSHRDRPGLIGAIG
mgnify:CR=1 FL=1